MSIVSPASSPCAPIAREASSAHGEGQHGLQLVVEGLQERGRRLGLVLPHPVDVRAQDGVELGDLEVGGELERLREEVRVPVQLLQQAREHGMVEEAGVVVDVLAGPGGVGDSGRALLRQ
ncbi:MAG TPA: hypothetical protein VH257_09200, partial [Chloroflexota bacterium]|nr:hypothetical protein [Chloroflexota bacterium]